MTEVAELVKKKKIEKLGVFGDVVHHGRLKLVKNHSETQTLAHNVQTLFLSALNCRRKRKQSYNKCLQLLIILKQVDFNCGGFCKIAFF